MGCEHEAAGADGVDRISTFVSQEVSPSRPLDPLAFGLGNPDFGGQDHGVSGVEHASREEFLALVGAQARMIEELTAR